ncbi:MAG: tRNA epoxyqueuosine(34) reductase QueG [Pseudomonadota bacterium]
MGAALRDRLEAQARAEGFAKLGICGPEAIGDAGKGLRAFLDAGFHGQMAWLGERVAWRSDPAAMWPEVRSIIMLAEPYSPDQDPLWLLEQTDRGYISVYARNRDYHDLVKKRLKRLGRWLIETAGGDIKVFVDTAPVMEKPLAAAAGLGWQGKHTNLLARDLGNYIFLGALFTTLPLPRDTSVTPSCGSCRACLDICPTDAFPAPYRLDARRCISYLTIEHKGPVDPSLRPALGNRIYGCDDCLAVCPWNKFAAQAHEHGYWARIELTCPKLAHLSALDDASFREVFSGSPIKRIGRDRFVRNVLYAIGNSAEPGLIPYAKARMDDPDSAVADAAAWAVARLMTEET